MNVLNIILFIFWITATYFFYVKWYTKNTSEWNAYLFISGFAFKILMGCLYGYVFQHFYNGDDTWLYHNQSLTETKNLLNEPKEFLKSIFLRGGLERYEMNSLWKELEYTLFIKILSIFNLISGGNYYLNIIIYGTITYPASIMLINFFSKIMPDRKILFCIVFFFFIPFVFWTSGIRREGFIVLTLAVSLCEFSLWINSKKNTHLLKTILAILIMGIFRYSLALSTIMTFILWLILDGSRQKWKPLNTIIIYSLIAAIIFFSTKWIGPINLPGIVAAQQKEFMQLKGSSYLPTEPLTDDAISFLTNLPAAIDHVFFRPYPNEKGSLLVQISKIETWFVVFLTIIFCLSTPKVQHHSVAFPILFFIILNFIVLGYTVPFLGAIVRYRAIFEILLISWMLCFMNFKRLPFIRKTN